MSDSALVQQLSSRHPEIPGAGAASVHGTASELVLYLYDRIPAHSLRVDGDAGLLDLLRAWEPEQ